MTRYPNQLPHFTYPKVPTLIIQGKEDVRTPSEVSKHVATLIPHAHRVVVPGAGHGTSLLVSNCARNQLEHFFAKEQVQKKCENVPTLLLPSQPLPRKPISLTPIKGLPLAIGRALAAVKLTLVDGLNAAKIASTLRKQRAAGLYGGPVVLDPQKPSQRTFFGYESIRGIHIYGKYRVLGRLAFPEGALRVAGKYAGELMINIRGDLDQVQMTGTLAGHAIDSTVPLVP